METSSPVIVRYPPSPTGFLQVGNVRTALFNYFFAKQHNGSFLLRMEDTDRTRSQKEYETDIINGLTWLGLTWDGEITRQSERTDIYTSYLQKLLTEDKAYISIETEGENKEVIRFRNPKKIVTFTDLIRGDISVDTTDLGDFIIAKNIHEPIYHFAVVVDDFESHVTHVIRGDDGIANTPRQILIQEALGAPRPLYAHVPLVLAEDRTKLSKRKHGESVSLKHYREEGYLPEAMINFLALIGWNPGTDQEIFTLDELCEVFNIQKVQKGGAVFDVKKLRFINKEHLKRLPEHDIKKTISDIFLQHDALIPPDRFDRAFPTIFERTEVFSDISRALETGEYVYLYTAVIPPIETIPWKESNVASTKQYLSELIPLIETITDFSSPDSIKEIIWPYAEEKGRGHVLWPLRISLSGLLKSPDPFTLLYILGKEESLTRLHNAKNAL